MTVKALDVEGLLPAVEGLFDSGPDAVSEPVSDSLVDRPDAILHSHAHLDHTALVDFSHPDVPVYATRGTSKMMLAGKLFARQAELPRDRLRPLTPGKPVRIGEINVTAFGFDSRSCSGLLLEAGGETLFYSGDLRMHGLNHLDMSRLLCERRRRARRRHRTRRIARRTQADPGPRRVPGTGISRVRLVKLSLDRPVR